MHKSPNLELSSNKALIKNRLYVHTRSSFPLSLIFLFFHAHSLWEPLKWDITISHIFVALCQQPTLHLLVPKWCFSHVDGATKLCHIYGILGLVQTYFVFVNQLTREFSYNLITILTSSLPLPYVSSYSHPNSYEWRRTTGYLTLGR